MGILRTDKISGLETPTSNDFGSNLLYNGDFSKGTDGWTATNSNHTVSSGQLTITNTGTNGRAISTGFDTVIGEVYEISIHNVSTTGQFRLEIREGNGGGSENNFDSNNSVAGVRTLRFVATETAHSLVVYAIGGSGTTSVYSDITVRKINNIVTGSVHFDGTGDYLSVTPVTYSLVNWWESDFTIEAWIYADSFSGWYADGNPGYKIPAMFGHMNPSDGINYWSFGPVENGRLEFYYWKGSQDHRFITSSSISTGKWSHIAMSYSVTNGAKVFIDGKGTGYISLDGTPQANASTAVTIGQYTGIGIEGYISNLRVLAGTALYTEDFTPPTHELEVIGDTVLLCCNNPDSVTAEGTGKILSSGGNPNFVTKNPGLTRDFTSGTEFRGVTTFDTQGYFVPPSGTTEQRGRGRGVFTAGSGTPGSTGSKTIEYVQISSSGNGIDFGDLTEGSQSQGAVSSTTRSVISLGDPVPAVQTNILEFITIATTGDSVDFGDLTTKRGRVSGVANQTRGVYIGGTNELVSPYSGSPISYTNTIDYITIASLGNAINFGDTITKASHGNAVCNSTRGLIAVNYTAAPRYAVKDIQYLTISTTGNTQDFGDLTRAETYLFRGCSGSNSTRGIFGGGYNGGIKNIIDYVTISTLGDAKDFGDLTLATRSGSTTSNSIRTMFFGGYNTSNGGRQNIISYVNIMTTGNAQDFGDCREKGHEGSASSDSHGGIS